MKKTLILSAACAVALSAGAANGSGWTDLGDALFMDGWVLPGLGINQFDQNNQYYVPLQRNEQNPNLFRLVDPYKTGPAAPYNSYQFEGQIVFDMTDPDHIVFNYEDAGFSDFSLGIDWFVCLNMMGWYRLMFEEYSVEELVNRLGDKCPYTTYKDGVVTLNSIIDSDGDIEYDANFAFQSVMMGGMQWGYIQPNFMGTMFCSITFPEGWDDENGISDLSADESVEPEYYTLGGQRVQNPAPGQLLIVRRGSTSTKVIF